jgi:hypothetical protein
MGYCHPVSLLYLAHEDFEFVWSYDKKSHSSAFEKANPQLYPVLE